MTRPFVCISDTHSHGGSVTSGAPDSDIGGKAIARVGDTAVCRTHGLVKIVSGDPNVTIGGRPVARDGDRLSCGAVLIASQRQTDSA
ncbi:PAAR domain-containing protein [Paraburkholderia graminis]|uniref:PAAR domain-containing protein n=1 Tax=Paraburkholderia graminis TaxID=60548 RepID=UPI00286AFDE4|nr:PAAR domain-containing protein [Paraburkholderia graminis]